LLLKEYGEIVFGHIAELNVICHQVFSTKF